MEKTIEIPEGYEARIEGNKVILEPKESEDERIRKELLNYIKYDKEHTPETTPGEHWDRWIAYLEKQKEQKPAEWSKEDEKNLKLAYDLLVNGVEADRRYPELISWLKSLRPSWKPSEEQISALERAIVKMHTPDDIGILAELRDILKKLSL